ncbi:MAG TPA: carboxypeptidase regulatory-like domain-containing protein [Pyrinomonadaceae bacterium]|nr:carboxypeptidase regulatory-like domain-containing protein [Pyrinomonadaceae bacterium]
MSTKQLKLGVVLTIVLSLLALGSACSKAPTNDSVATNESAQTGTPYTAGNGSVTGAIAYNGVAPAPKKIDSSADPACGTANPNLMTEDTVVKDGKLANAFVYVKDGTTADGKKIGDFTYPTPSTAAGLDQKGCHYVPHVMGIQTNQKLSITNSDPTQHNIHPTPKSNPEWNQTQPNGAAPIEKTFARAEVLIPVKCNQHPWMKAYIGVLKHPFFAVSGEDGAYTIKGLQPGTYTVAAWHEKGGPNGTEKTMQVTVPASGAGKADFAFGEAAATASSKPGLEMMPALEVPLIGKHK